MALDHVATVFDDVESDAANPQTTYTPQAGSVLIWVLNWGDSAGTTLDSVEDNQGNTWVPTGPEVVNGQHHVRAFMAENVVAGLTTITGHFSADPDGFVESYLSEYSGAETVGALDQHAENTGAGGDPDSGAKTTLFANELIWGFASAGSGAVVNGAGFTSRESTNGNRVEDKLVSAVGSYSAAFTGGTDWLAIMVTLVEAGQRSAVAGNPVPWIE